MICVVCGTEMDEQNTALICPLCVKGNRLACVQRKRANDDLRQRKAEAFDWLEKWLLDKEQHVSYDHRGTGSYSLWRWGEVGNRLDIRTSGTGPDLLAAIRDAMKREVADNGKP